MKRFLAFDLGAESGRAMLGRLDGARLALDELHRFPNIPVRLPDGLYWDILRLFGDIQTGLRKAAHTGPLDGIGIDTWGVDFAFIGEDGKLVSNPRHYRDHRNHGQMERVFETVPRGEVFRQTGLQFMHLNSLFQWYSMREDSTLRSAATLLFTPDLLNFWLTGEKRAERTIASTSQFYNPVEKCFAEPLLRKLALNPALLPPLVDPATRLGSLLPVYELGDTPVFAVGGHDTASAVAAVPASPETGWCYVSSGTWSLMGVEIGEPVVNDRCLDLNFTNEVGVAGTVRLLKNIAGLWLLQECRREWALAGSEYSYEQLAEMAASAPPFSAIIHPDSFVDPGHMPARISEWCRSQGQTAPADHGAMARAILEGLALRYRQVLDSLEELTRIRIGTIHIVGGGSRNALLNQFVADATGRTVIAGPAEATAIGNILVQAMGDGIVSGLPHLREVVRCSFPTARFNPGPSAPWDRAFEYFCRIQ